MKFFSLIAAAVAITISKDKALDPPDRFSADTDDIFMRSMYDKYASHLKIKDDKGKEIDTGKIVITKSSAMALADEVIATHKPQLDASGHSAWNNDYFQKAWDHYDVN